MTLWIGSTRQLFLDDAVVDGLENVRRRLHRPARYSAAPIVVSDRPWERGGSGVDLAGGTVLFARAEGLFKMWYWTNQAILETAVDGTVREATGAAYMTCYAVSRDGVAWEKPGLGLAEFAGTRDNNVLQGGAGHSRLPRPSFARATHRTSRRDVAVRKSKSVSRSLRPAVAAPSARAGMQLPAPVSPDPCKFIDSNGFPCLPYLKTGL